MAIIGATGKTASGQVKKITYNSDLFTKEQAFKNAGLVGGTSTPTQSVTPPPTGQQEISPGRFQPFPTAPVDPGPSRLATPGGFAQQAQQQGFNLNPQTGEVIKPTPGLVNQFNQQFTTTRPSFDPLPGQPGFNTLSGTPAFQGQLGALQGGGGQASSTPIDTRFLTPEQAANVRAAEASSQQLGQLVQQGFGNVDIGKLPPGTDISQIPSLFGQQTGGGGNTGSGGFQPGTFQPGTPSPLDFQSNQLIQGLEQQLAALQQTLSQALTPSEKELAVQTQLENIITSAELGINKDLG